MRINGPNNMDVHGLGDPMPTGKGTKPAASSASQASTDGLEIISSSQAFVDAAKATPEIDAQAVAQARQLLKSGQLDTPDAIQRAAQRMMDVGL